MRTFKTGGKSICFQCGKQLVRIKGGFHFRIFADPLGNTVRVHKTDCPEQIIKDSYKEVKVES